MITAAQLRAARSLAGLDQRELADLSGLSVPTIQRMEASEDMVRGNVDSLTKLIAALDRVGVEFLDEDVVGPAGGRGVRFKKSRNAATDLWAFSSARPGVRDKKSQVAPRNFREAEEAGRAVSQSRRKGSP